MFDLQRQTKICFAKVSPFIKGQSFLQKEAKIYIYKKQSFW